MASFYAELQVSGATYPVRTCAYEFAQATGERGRPVAKVRHGLVRLTLDVPNDELLLSWAAAAYKPLAGRVVFRDAKGGAALETLSWEEGQCVGYQEQFVSGDVDQGAYVCHLTIVAPKLALAPGGPDSYISPAAGEHGSPMSAAAALLAATKLQAEQLATGLVKKIITPAGELGIEVLGIGGAAIARAASLTLGLVLTPTNSRDDPGYAAEWELYRRNHRHLTPVTPDQLRLAQLEQLHAQGDLTPEEEAELIALLGKVKGIHIQRLVDLADKTPFGFPSSEDFTKAGEELKAALNQSGLHYKSVGVRGSSVTGLSSKGGNFRNEPTNGLPASDVDVFIELSKDVDLTDSKSIPGFIHPDKLLKRYPALKQWSKKWTQKLGREITPGAFKPGTFVDKDFILFK